LRPEPALRRRRPRRRPAAGRPVRPPRGPRRGRRHRPFSPVPRVEPRLARPGRRVRREGPGVPAGARRPAGAAGRPLVGRARRHEPDTVHDEAERPAQSMMMALVYRVYSNGGTGGPVDFTSPVATTGGLTSTVGPLAPSTDTTFVVRAFDPATGLEEA